MQTIKIVQLAGQHSSVAEHTNVELLGGFLDEKASAQSQASPEVFKKTGLHTILNPYLYRCLQPDACRIENLLKGCYVQAPQSKIAGGFYS